MNDEAQEQVRIATEYMRKEGERRRALRGLLDSQQAKRNHHIALPSRMGSSTSYLISVSLRWIASNVYFARDLPIFAGHLREGSHEISINDTTIVNLQQREPDFRRQLPMTIYLATREHHKFPPLFLVAYQNWAYDRNSNKWGPDRRAMESSLNVEPLDSRSALVDLDITNTSYFALDGQHRLMAIKGLHELLDGRLYAKKQDGSPLSKQSVSRDEVEIHTIASESLAERGRIPFQNLLDEVMGVEILPAVQLNDTYEKAVSRLRNIFVDVNENAKRLEKGEISLLDENDGFRIIARTLMVTHPIFKKDQKLRVDTKRDQLAETSEDYTTLTTVVRIATEYLGHDFERWKIPLFGVKGAGLERPEDDEIERGLTKLADYFTALEILPSHGRMMKGTQVSALRRQDGEDNILFRPIAQVALARALAHLQAKDGDDLHDLMSIVAKYEMKGHLKLTSKTAPWFGILCDPITNTVRRQKRFEVICSRMIIYLLGVELADPRAVEELRLDFFDARKGSTDSATLVAYDMSGALVGDSRFVLPRRWR